MVMATNPVWAKSNVMLTKRVVLGNIWCDLQAARLFRKSSAYAGAREGS
eukprot:CAMPEP_0174862930 /NCGR_PEP_ID=MMETSP1114-20130205/55186_1 /TAXON_ID=312471 /ORGANISM="Neobodo designis, Strain CCAP 1951/1" /LENGTH=48 /DNA_ID= /DNA_START= /DNA_END= /DNA_ORIENTATION=